jgi:hypothetical protein
MSAPVGVQILFRGESLSPLRYDQERVNRIKEFHRTGNGLWTKLGNRGDPYALARMGLVEAVRTHVCIPERFEKTHFLSFTSDETVALRYATSPAVEDPDDVSPAHRPDEGWTYTRYAVFELRIEAREHVGAGIYRLRYNGAHLAVLIDASGYLAALPSASRTGALFEEAKSMATADSEWLVLPADPVGDGTLSALLRKGSDFDVQHYVESAFFIDGGSSFLA